PLEHRRVHLCEAPRGCAGVQQAPVARPGAAAHRPPEGPSRCRAGRAAAAVRAGGRTTRGDTVGAPAMSLLHAAGVTKTFEGITALDDVSLDVDKGEVVGLIGPNGAGKTTFFNCLLGMLKPDAGVVTFAVHDLSKVPPHQRARFGIGRTFQRIVPFS